jgi:acetyltransferase
MNVRQRIADHARHVHLHDGTLIYLRPLRDDDFAHAEVYFRGLSARSRYLRFMAPTKSLSPSTLRDLRHAMNGRASAVTVVVVDHGAPRGEERIGGARIVPTRQRGTCEFAISLLDAWQGRGVGGVLLREAVDLARQHGYRRIEGQVLTVNTRMLVVARHLRFSIRHDPHDPSLSIVSRTVFPK